MQKGNKFRIYPTTEQKIMFAQHFGSGRFIYNKMLEIKQLFYKKFKIILSEYELSKHLPVLKECYPWLKDVDAWSLQHVNGYLQEAYKNFFRHITDFPRRKSKKDNHQSYSVMAYKINFETNQIYIPKIGWIKVKLHRDLFDFQFAIHNLEYTKDVILEQSKNSQYLKKLTISKTPTDKYYISILTNDQRDNPQKQHYDESNTIGVDVGLKSFAVTSNEEVIDNPKYLNKSLRKLKHLQRCASRKKKGSKNKKKAVKRLAKCHEKVSNQRHDFQHKLSKQLICENQAVVIEDLNIKGMLKNHKLAQSISDAAWSSFIFKLCYKAEWFGKTILKIGRFEPSSKTCNICGYKKVNLTLGDREWICPECNILHDRDINAAKNIKNFVLSSPGRRVELGNSLTRVKGMNQEVLL